jgi:hypothetical protein
MERVAGLMQLLRVLKAGEVFALASGLRPGVWETEIGGKWEKHRKVFCPPRSDQAAFSHRASMIRLVCRQSFAFAVVRP